jgi:hypothetical protein
LAISSFFTAAVSGGAAIAVEVTKVKSSNVARFIARG